jgi:hypothetical protein
MAASAPSAVTRASGSRVVGWTVRRRWDLLAVLALVGLTTVIQLRYLRPPWIYDPADYYFSATRWPDVFIHHRPLRVGLVVPVRMLQEVFGLSEASWYGVPLISLVVLVLATYAVGRMLFGRTVGFAAAALIVLNPYILQWSSQIFPDIPSAALFTAAVALVLRVARRRRGGQALEVDDHLWLVGAGLLLGWAYLVREFVVVLFPVVVVVLLVYRVRWRSLVPIASSAAAVFVAEIAFNAWQYGDGLLRMREIVEKPELRGERELARVAARRAARGSTLDRLGLLPRLLRRYPTGTPLLVLGGIGVVGLAADRERRGLPLVAWAITIWGVLIGLSFIEVNGGQALLHPNLLRYWYPLFPPLVILGLGGAWVLARRLSGSTVLAVGAVVVAACLVAVPAVRAIERQPGTLAKGADHYREFRDHLRTTQPDAPVVWTDDRTGRTLGVFVTRPFGGPVWDGAVGLYRSGNSYQDPDRLEGSLVLLEEQFFEPRHSNARGSVPDWLMAIPDEWDLRWMADNSEIALFDTRPGGDDVRASVSVPGEDWSWTALPRAGESVREPMRLDPRGGIASLRLGRDERAIIVDGGHPSMTSGDGGVAVSAGSYVGFDLDVGARGEGNVSLRCLVFSEDGRREPNVVSLWGVPSPLRKVGGACRAPVAGSFRLALDVRGPIELELGSLTVWVDDDGEDR